MKSWIIIVGFILPGYCLAQQAPIISAAKLKQMMESPEDKVLIVNFWATWCGPCVAELPLFEKLTAEARKDLRVALVSLDMDLDPNPGKVYKFIERKALKSEVYLLNEPDPNSWIDQIENEWSGALPATVVINKKTGKRKFFGKQLHEGDLEKLIALVQE
jgi:thiol-disulfide isomerase/thioredoxin